jgi:[protein-PII] uridylyltransferase
MPFRLRPARIEHVVDGAKLRTQLTAAALDHIGDEEGLRSRAQQLLHHALFRGRMIAKERLYDGASGLETAQLLAKVADEVIQALFDFVTTHVFRSRNPTEGERFSLMAVGGYGRGQLAPSSDIDLLFLRAYKQTPWSESITEYMLYMLWDLGLKVGHASRTIDECIRLAKSDHTIQTALLESRRLAGDQSLAAEFAARFNRDVVAPGHRAFIQAKLKERDERHARAGASRYLVEPNLKDGKGGLRDLHTLFWIVRHCYGAADPAEYARLGLFTTEELGVFVRATEFLWRVRCHLHFLTGRAEERLTFDLQPEMAQLMGYGARGENPAVERFMKRYFLVAKQVGSLTRILCAKLEADQQKRAPSLTRLISSAPLGDPLRAPGYRIEAGRLAVADPSHFAADPVNLLRIFELADARNLDIHPETLTEVTRSLRRITPAVRRDPGAAGVFLNIIASKNNPGRTLALMNEAGVLGRFIPEFGRIVAQMQFNMYHHFTVDEHTLRAIEIISDIEHGRFAKDHPLSTQIFPKIINRRALFLAMLLHDTGKGIGDQQEEGEKAAIAACSRLGLPPEEVELVGWLVGNHLTMSDTAQKRDIGDPRTIARFAELVGTLERLRLLLVLTVADIRAVGPGVWNGWKGQLLRDLYRLTEATFHGGRTDEAAVRERLKEQGQQVRAALIAEAPGERAQELASWLDRFEEDYLVSFDREAILWHAEGAAGAREGPRVAARKTPRRGVTEVLVETEDRPGLFARLARAFAAAGADVTDARVMTTRDGAAFDVFSIQDAAGDPFGMIDPAALDQLLFRLRDAAGGLAPASPLQPPAVQRRAAAFMIEPWVRFDNDLSQASTVVEVSGRDRPGLLADLARVLAEGRASVVSAHIDAYGERVSDVFYVQDLDGGKLTAPERIDALQRELVDVLRQGEPESPSSIGRQKLAVAPASQLR